MPWLFGVCACCTDAVPYCVGLDAGTEGLSVDMVLPISRWVGMAGSEGRWRGPKVHTRLAKHSARSH